VEQAGDLAVVRAAARRAVPWRGATESLQAEGQKVAESLEGGESRASRRPGAAIHTMALCHLRWAPLQQWLKACATRKRWLTPEGQAFRLIPFEGRFMGASHIARLLA